MTLTLTRGQHLRLDDGTQVYVSGLEIEQLRGLFDDGEGVPLDRIAEGTTFSGHHLTVRQLRRLVDGAYLRGVAASWNVPHAKQIGDRIVHQMLDRDSIIIDEPVPLIIAHDYTRRVGTVTTWHNTGFGLEIEAHVDRDHVSEVERLLPSGLSTSLWCDDPTADEWLDDNTVLRRNAPLIEISLLTNPATRSATTDRRLYDRSEHDEWYDRVRFERLESRLHGRRLDDRLARLGVAT